MLSKDDRILTKAFHPIHGVFLAGMVPLYLGGLLSDIAYANSYQIQWTNFASWFVAGGNFFAGCALLWAIVNLTREYYRNAPSFFLTLGIGMTWLLGFLNSLIHAKDAWASMPTGLVLSIVVLLLACVCTGIGFSKFGVGGGR